MIVWLPTTLLVGWVAWRLSTLIAPSDPPATHLLRAVIFLWALVVAAGTLLGSMGWLYPAALLALVAATAGFVWHKTKHLATPRCSGQLDWSAVILWAGFVTLWSGHIVLQGLLRFPFDWDTLMYHLPLVDQWLQVRSLYAPRDGVWYNPGNNELVGLWIVGPFSGDFLIALNNLPAVTVLLLGSVELGTQLGLGRLLALMSGLIVTVNRVVLRQLVDAENDIAAAGLFVTSLAFALRHARSRNRGDLIYGATAIGLLAGIKYYALGFAAVAAGAAVLAAWLVGGTRLAVRTLAIAVIGMSLFGSYWYIRNTCLTGTPIYPRGFTTRTDVVTQWPAWRQGVWHTTILGSGRAEVAPLLLTAVHSRAGVWAFAAFLAVPISIAWLVFWPVWNRNQLANETMPRLVISAALMASGGVWAIIPWSVETESGTLNILRDEYQPVRFGLSFLSLAAIAFLAMVRDIFDGPNVTTRSTIRQSLSRRRQILRFGFTLLLSGTLAHQVYTQVIEPNTLDGCFKSLLLSINVALAGAIFILIGQCWPTIRPQLVIGGSVGLLFSLACGAELLANRWHAGFTTFYDRTFSVTGCEYLASRDSQTTRICALTYRYYPFLGSRREYYVARPQRMLNYASLRDYLLAHDINLVFAITTDPFPNSFYRDQHRWIEERPEVFRNVHEEDGGKVYEVDIEALRKE